MFNSVLFFKVCQTNLRRMQQIKKKKKSNAQENSIPLPLWLPCCRALASRHRRPATTRAGMVFFFWRCPSHHPRDPRWLLALLLLLLLLLLLHLTRKRKAGPRQRREGQRHTPTAAHLSLTRSPRWRRLLALHLPFSRPISPRSSTSNKRARSRPQVQVPSPPASLQAPSPPLLLPCPPRLRRFSSHWRASSGVWGGACPGRDQRISRQARAEQSHPQPACSTTSFGNTCLPSRATYLT